MPFDVGPNVAKIISDSMKMLSAIETKIVLCIIIGVMLYKWIRGK